MILLELVIINFKGINRFSLKTDGKNCYVYGRNGTGKTTIADAFRWLLFDKDTNERMAYGRAPFIIKPIGNNGGKGTEHEVYAKILQNENIIQLRKIHSERFNRNGDLLGSTTKYYLNEVPDITEKRFKEYIRSIIDEKIFKLLIDPIYFSEILPWQERRQIIFELETLRTDQEIIYGNQELSGINEFLEGHTIDDCRIILRERRRKIQEVQNEIPTRIDEVEKAIKEISMDKEDDIDKEMESLKKQITEAKEKRLMIKNQNGIIPQKAKLLELQQNISNFILDYEKGIDLQIREAEKTLLKIEDDYEDRNKKEDKKLSELKEIEGQIINLEEKVFGLREAWHKENESAFELSTDFFMASSQKEQILCPNCKKDLLCAACSANVSEHMNDEIREKALASFNKEKATNLESIQNEGRKTKSLLEVTKKKAESLKNVIDSIKKEKEDINREGIKIEKKIQTIKDLKDKYVEKKEFKELTEKELRLNTEIEKLEKGEKDDTLQNINTEIEEMEKALEILENNSLEIKKNKEQKLRVEELEKESKRLANELLKIKKKIALLDKFTKIKVQMIEGKINDKFKLVSFKLFHQQVNGELEPCCEVTDKKGVPFITNLNRGARLNSGLDIIDVLSEHFGLVAPIFIDNAEGVTDIIDTKGQQIQLNVLPDLEKIIKLTDKISKLDTKDDLKVLTS